MSSSLVTALLVNTGRLRTLGVPVGVKLVTSDSPLVTLVVSAMLLLIPLLDFNFYNLKNL